MLLLMIVFVWWHKATCQSNTGLEQYCFMDNKSITLSPKAWYQFNSGWYVEGRYNYDAAQTASVYGGKTFEHEATFSYELTPLLGIIRGKLNGGAIGENATVTYKKFMFSIQSQYMFSTQNTALNSMYSWSDLSYDFFKGLSAGVSMQRTNLYHTKGTSEKGIFLKAEFGKWEFPVYVFNPEGSERYVVMGLNYTHR
ncbi:MAG: hypothetical protein JWP81_5028 [Ferruginibacter sp.]|nr:hypothetical protein [Ferruginibacter sp.]